MVPTYSESEPELPSEGEYLSEILLTFASCSATSSLRHLDPDLALLGLEPRLVPLPALLPFGSTTSPQRARSRIR